MPLTIGQVVNNRYRILTLLGQGGMGAVYHAWDMNLNLAVALKEMTPDPRADPPTLAQLRQQFQREAQVVAGLNHPNLVRVTDYFSWGGSECLVMNFVQGESLAQRVAREGAQPEALVLAWAAQLLDALAYCHDRGVIHRDLKPQNVILTPQGQPVLVDFGLVKLWDPHDPRTMTAMRGLGTPAYTPLEQYASGPGHTDARSDIYSLGATLYHALTGQPPADAPQRFVNPAALPAPRTLNPHITAQTELAVLKALEVHPQDRFQSTAEMRAALMAPPPAYAPPTVAMPAPYTPPPGAVVPPSLAGKGAGGYSPAKPGLGKVAAAGGALLAVVAVLTGLALLVVLAALAGTVTTSGQPRSTQVVRAATNTPSATLPLTSTPVPPTPMPTLRPTNTPAITPSPTRWLPTPTRVPTAMLPVLNDYTFR